jgi:hypothetical protein
MRLARLAGLVLAGLMAVGFLGLLLSKALAPALFLLVEALVVVIGTLFERVTYKALEGRPGKGWSATEERFIDPTSGRMVRVWARAGERVYVDDGAPPQGRA